MTIKTFRATNKDNVITIPFSSITLKESCHIKAVEKGTQASRLNTDPVCIVHENDNGTYNLIIGYCDYMTAKSNGAEEIKVIIVPDNSRKKFLERLSNIYEIWNTSDVHTPGNWGLPRFEKIAACLDSYKKDGNFGKHIIISSNGTILDGYAAVCAARLLNIDMIPVYVR